MDSLVLYALVFSCISVLVFFSFLVQQHSDISVVSFYQTFCFSHSLYESRMSMGLFFLIKGDPSFYVYVFKI